MDAGAGSVNLTQERVVQGVQHHRPLSVFAFHAQLDSTRAGHALAQSASHAKATLDDGLESGNGLESGGPAP
jgi:hypothetical protein